MSFIVYCKNAKCIWCKFNQEESSICDRKRTELYINEEGECALIVLRQAEPKKCPWPCDYMYPHAGHNFCSFCGRDLRLTKQKA